MITSNYVKSKKQYKVSFELSPERVGKDRDVRVLGSFNDWSWEDGLKLKSGKQGYTGATQLPAGHYQFRYLVDKQEWHNDDHAEAYTDSGHGTTNCCFSLEQVEEKAAPKKAAAKKPAAKKSVAKATADTIESATSAPATKPVVTPEKKAAAKKPATKKPAAKKTATRKAAAKSKGDDLKKIEGIGPKIAGLLNEAGINTYSDLAKAKEKQLADVLQKAGARFRLAKHDTWQEQAKLAADGKVDELKKLQDQLKGGRK
ncbi:helix-hairpin-helix domain-containing protein [Lewinella sp. IMCC34183]|uniref:helix-hairpin-helix domain-containing protein n=1 Tax=Lewinella sp. IMCC34183 TaxID=2248762 RepID=UPI000E2411C2|nr:helix-hairpin-helix domain-containing protein [Lewinella sp. IMCC34183]